MRPKRTTLPALVGLTALAAALLGGGVGAAQAQIYGGYAGYGPGVYGVNFGAVGFSPVAFGLNTYGFPGYGYGVGGYGMPGYFGGAGAYGWGGYGWGGYGWGGYPWMGMSLADQSMTKYQTYALNSARYNMMNARTATAYEAANLLQQEALHTMLQNYTGGKANANSGAGNVPGYDYSYGNSGGAQNDRKVTGDIPFNQLVARDGEILWPLGAPDDGDLGEKRQKAAQLIQQLVRDYGKDGEVAVRDVVQARRALSDYAVLAARQVKEQSPDDYDPFVNYVASLDRGLRGLAGLEGAGEGRGRRAPAEAVNIDVKPENTPKNAGDVLKEQVKKGTDQPEPKSPRP